MCETLRNTLRRGRSFVPEIRFLRRIAMRTRRSSLVLIFIFYPCAGAPPPAPVPSRPAPLGFACSDSPLSATIRRGATPPALFRSGLPGFLLQHFARVADALLLVGIRFAQPTDIGRHLSHQLTVDAGHGDVRLLLNRDVNPDWDVKHDRMRVTQRENDLLPFHLRAVADA